LKGNSKSKVTGGGNMAKKVLIVYHSQGGNTEAAAQAVAAGVRSVQGVQPVLKSAQDATTDDLRSCDAVCFGSPDYFSYMAGMLKDFFDRTFYPTQGEVDDKVCGIFITHGGGGAASESVVKVCRSFKFKLIANPVMVRGKPDGSAEAALKKLGVEIAGKVV
jgi:multimeric flavodoxin WrbA